MKERFSIILLPNETLMFLANVIYLLNTGVFERHDLSIVSPLDELNDTGPTLIIKYVD